MLELAFLLLFVLFAYFLYQGILLFFLPGHNLPKKKIKITHNPYSLIGYISLAGTVMFLFTGHIIAGIISASIFMLFSAFTVDFR